MAERLQKIISSAGAASRRRAEELIKAGRVTVNGAPASLGMSADAAVDDIRIDGRPLAAAPEERVYIMLNKPRGYVTTLSDERGRPAVTELVRLPGRRVYPVGRLDMYSEGLLILTDDGETANALMHPSHDAPRKYIVDVIGTGLEEAAKVITSQTEVDGQPVRPAEVRVLRTAERGGRLEVTIHEGRNRQVRRLCAAAGLKVSRLRRIAEGELLLGSLPSGKWRYLTEEEVRYIKSL
ncbi:MAG TPA: rRNA pseudouridine synthase [Candidatus Scatomorpha intestinavium]|uniref:Pseudouridine synthase n=1 Tax=Candidatus Scatomorpha intestinavium TaxID=2840922 RepID=A0A9D0ZEI6_9FIRM|nr:rRNA pseudouridine synthase [Candidatus Scatomorpha intestinavium]